MHVCARRGEGGAEGGGAQSALSDSCFSSVKSATSPDDQRASRPWSGACRETTPPSCRHQEQPHIYPEENVEQPQATSRVHALRNCRPAVPLPRPAFWEC